jgi:exosortase/archaeosortase family protein
MKKQLDKLRTNITPYKGILYFLFLLFFFHFSWKIAIDGDMEDTRMYLFGKDITPGWFDAACRWLTAAGAWFIHLFPNTQDLITTDTTFHFPNGGITISIIWGCTGIKQMFIFVMLMICYFGPWKQKLWYIPMGCVILTAYNIVRVGSIVMLTNGHPERFESLHDGIFRYIYYSIIFILWVCWEEFINMRAQSIRKKAKGNKEEEE